MKSFSNSLYSNIPEPESFEEIIQLISSLRDTEDGSSVRMWRGQADIEWKFHSSAYRRLKIDAPSVTDKTLEHYELNLLKHARHKGYHLSGGRVLSDFELLALLQHNGAATRLVDFSRNALVGLWFAVSSYPDKTGLLIGSYAWYLGGYENEPEDRPYEEVVKRIKNFDHPTTWEPTSINNRIAAQHSQFLYSKVSDSELGSLLISPEKEGNQFIALNSKLKWKVKFILSSIFDIREQTLFPDLAGFSVSNNAYKPEVEMFRW